MKKVLLCPPTYYDIEYEINPWMHIANKVDSKSAQDAFIKLKNIYKELGVEVMEIFPENGLPDMVYAANYGFPKNNFFIKANFKYDQRKKESEIAKTYFEKLGFEIKEIPQGIIWEGQGELLGAGGKYFLGWGRRSDFEAKKYIEDFLNSEIIDLKLIDPYYYHLDMCFTPLDDKTVAINPLSFGAEDLEKINRHFPNVIKVNKKDNAIMGCNAFVVNKTIVCSAGISQELKDDYAKYGFTTREVSMDEFRKGGGGIKCLTLEFY